MARKSLFRPCLGIISKTASLLQIEIVLQGCIVLAPAANSEEALWAPVCGGWGSPAAWRRPFFLPWQGASRKLSIVLPFLVSFGTGPRAWVFTGPIWRQVFQIKNFSPSLKDGCSLREAAAPPPCWGTSTLINDDLFGWSALLRVFGFLLPPPARVQRCLS